MKMGLFIGNQSDQVIKLFLVQLKVMIHLCIADEKEDVKKVFAITSGIEIRNNAAFISKLPFRPVPPIEMNYLWLCSFVLFRQSFAAVR